MRTVEKYLSEDKKTKIKGYLFEPQTVYPNVKPWTPEKRPAMLILPGGYYFYCSEREADPVAVRFSQKGYQTFILEYSCGKESEYPQPLLDVAEAVEYIKENAEEFLVDSDNITLAGFSAGGHLALTYGSSFFREEFQELTGKKEEELKITQIIAAYPVANLNALHSHAMSLSEDEQSKYHVGEMFVNYEERRDPIKLIDKRVPRTFIYTTLGDALIPASDTVEYVRAALEKGMDLEFHLYNKGSHGLSTGDDLANYGRDYPRRVGSWVELAFEWLEDL